jgi:hypothetical protein
MTMRRADLRRASSKAGIAFNICNGCLNFRPLIWSVAGWTGPWFCRACTSRIWSSGLHWRPWHEANRAYLASQGWTGYQ